MSNPHIFKTELFVTYLKGLFPEGMVRSTNRYKGVRVVLTGNIVTAFTIDFDDDNVLDLDYDKIRDENDVSVDHVLKMDALVGKIILSFQNEYKDLCKVQKWWDGDTSIVTSECVTVNCNFITSECKIINNNPHLLSGIHESFPLVEDNIEVLLLDCYLMLE